MPIQIGYFLIRFTSKKTNLSSNEHFSRTKDKLFLANLSNFKANTTSKQINKKYTSKDDSKDRKNFKYFYIMKVKNYSILLLLSFQKLNIFYLLEA
jgi:hypothetical protein